MPKRKSLPPFLSFALGALAALTIAGPAAIQLTSADEEPVFETTEETLEVTADPCATPTPATTPTPDASTTPEPTPTPEATPTPAPSPTTVDCEEDDDDDDADDADAEDEGDDGTNTSFHQPHGRAVSTAAHCPLKGRAHGELVRSIAHDKDATVEEAQAACDAALAAAAAAAESSTDAGPGHGKKDHGNGRWAREDDDTDVAEESDDDSDMSVDAGDESTKGGPPSWAGGNKDR